MKRVLIIVGVLAVVVFFVFVLRSADSRDWAEVTLVSATATQDGQVTAQFITRHSNGAGIESAHYIDGVYVGRGSGRSRSLPFMISSGSESTSFHLNPERVPVSGNFTNSELFARLLMRVGETRRIHKGESFALYDFSAAGKHYECDFRVIPRDVP